MNKRATTHVTTQTSTSTKTLTISTTNKTLLPVTKSDKTTSTVEHKENPSNFFQNKNPLLELFNLISPKEDRSFLFDFLNFNKKPVDDNSKAEKELKDKLIHELLVFINKDNRDEEDILNILRLIKMVKEQRKTSTVKSLLL